MSHLRKTWTWEVLVGCLGGDGWRLVVLTDCGGDQGVEKSDNGIVDVPERSDSNLANQEDSDGNQCG
jgi:hypothetical protein